MARGKAKSQPQPQAATSTPETTPGVDPQQFNLLMQQVQNLTTAVAQLQHVTESLKEQPAPPAIPSHCSQRRSGRPPPSKEESGRAEQSWGAESSFPAPNQGKEKEFEEKLQSLEQRLRAIQCGGSSGQKGFDLQSPFSPEVLKEPIPPRFKVPPLESFDGSSDPVEHLEGFKAVMRLQGASEALQCLIFPITLKKAARLWFSGLKQGTIDSLESLAGAFVSYFGSNRMHLKNNNSLFSVKQQEGESLRGFIARFNSATLEVKDFNESVAMAALKQGLRSNRLIFSLNKNYPSTYEQMLDRVRKYAQAEEEESIHRHTQKEGRRRPREEDRRSRPAGLDDSRKRRRSRSPPRNFHSYAPLSAPRAQILMEIERQGYLKRPAPLRSPPEKRDRNKYCRYHRDHGHDTEECRVLKDAIEALIRRGHLRQYIRTEPGSSSAPGKAPAREDEPGRPAAGVIGTIA